MGIADIVPAGVITGDDVLKVFQYAEEHNFAIPSINATSTRYCIFFHNIIDIYNREKGRDFSRIFKFEFTL